MLFSPFLKHCLFLYDSIFYPLSYIVRRSESKLRPNKNIGRLLKANNSRYFLYDIACFPPHRVPLSYILGDFHPDPHLRYALVMGNEVKGVGQQVVDACDLALEIPQYGTKHSLNVSVTAGIVMWEMLRAMKQGELA